MKRAAALAGLAVALVGLGLGAAAINDGEAKPNSGRDRAALERNIRVGGGGSFARPYSRLVEMLPNAKDRQGSSISDSVVLGVVDSVRDGAGYVESGQAPTAGHPGARVTTFNDPLADWRSIQVVVAVKETIAGQPTDELVISWPLMGNSLRGDEKEAVARALKALGEVVVFSTTRPSGPEFLGIGREIPDREYGIAVLGDDGGLRFPFIGEGASGAAKASEFAGDLDTLAALRTAAKKPTWTRPVG